MKFKHSKLVLLATIISFASCDKEDMESGSNAYSGVGVVGDLITYQLDKTNKTYTLNNETTGNQESGDFSIKSETLFNGIYQLESGGTSFFGVELDDKISVMNFPSGNTANALTFGVSSEIDNTEWSSSFAGDYMYVYLGDYLDTDPMTWGQITLNGSDCHTTSFNGVGPEDAPVNYPLTASNADDSFTWQLDGQKKDRITIDAGIAGTYTGFAYAGADFGTFLLDLGPGAGVMIAYKVQNATLSSIAGDYKFVDYDIYGNRGGGNYTISSDGTVKYSWTDGDANNTIEDETLLSQLTASYIPNVYYATNINSYGDNLYVVICGNAIMHYIFDSNYSFVGYGAGAKL